MNKNMVLLIVFCFFTVIVFANPEINPAALNHYNRGMEYYNSNDFDSAIIEFTNAINIFPEYVDAYRERGNSYDNKSDVDKAIENYLLAGKYDEKYLLFAYGYECATEKMQNYEEAITVLTRCIELDINTFIAYCMRGNSYAGMDDYETAIENYDEAIKINPNIFQPYFSRGSMNFELGNFSESIRDYEKAVELCPDFYIAFYMLGILYFLEGNFMKAEEMMLFFRIYSENIIL